MSTSKPFLLTGRVSANVNPAHGGYRPEETRKFMLLFRAWAARSGAGFDENVVKAILAALPEETRAKVAQDLVVLLEHMSSSGWLDRLHDVMAGLAPDKIRG